MSKKYLFSTFMLFIFAALLMPQDVYAQIKPDSPVGVKRIKMRRSKSLLPRDHYNVEFFNKPKFSENLFVMRLFPSGEITGCAQIRKGSGQKKTLMGNLELKVTDPAIRVNKKQPRYSLYDCDVNISSAVIDITLDRDKLIEEGIKKIALESRQYGTFMTSDLTITKEKLELLTPNNQGGSLVTFWFYPENAVVLQAASAPNGMNVQQEIRDFADEQGFIPMEEVFNDYTLPNDADDYAVFIDPSRTISDKLDEASDYMNVGTLQKMRTLRGKDGAYEEPMNIDVIARLPIIDRD